MDNMRIYFEKRKKKYLEEKKYCNNLQLNMHISLVYRHDIIFKYILCLVRRIY